LALIATEMTGLGTNIEVIATLTVPSVNVSPELQSMPNSAQMSPADVSVMSSLSSECMRTRRPTFTFLPVRVLVMKSSFSSVPW
jgi:hypothetical protein